MSNCTIIQMKNKILIGADTASSIKIGNVRYRVSNNIPKIHMINNMAIFCSGKMNICEEIIAKIKMENVNNVHRISEIAINETAYSPMNDEYAVEIIVAKVFNNKSIIYQISSYNNFEIIEKVFLEEGMYIYTAGIKTNESLEIITNNIYNQIPLLEAYYHMYNKITDESVGGFAQVFLITEKESKIILNKKIIENNILYINQLANEQELVVGEKVVGKLLAGNSLIIENEDGSFRVDGGTIYISSEAVTIDGGLPESQLNQDSTSKWNNTANYVDLIVADNKLTPYEKTQLKDRWNNMEITYTKNMQTIDTYYGSDKENTQFVIDYEMARNRLYNYLLSDVQHDGYTLLDDSRSGVTSTIDDVTVYKQKFDDYFTAEANAEQQIAWKAKDFADTVQSNLDDVKNDIVYKVELHSTAGTQFINGNISTNIYVRVWKGSTEITDTLPNSAFKWKKTNENGIEDSLWSSNHIGVGKQIVVTKDDVLRKATFWCDIDVI